VLQAGIGPGFQYSWPAGAIIGADSSRAVFYPEDSSLILVSISDSLLCTGQGRFFLQPVKLDTGFRMISEFNPCTDELRYRFESAGLSGHTYIWSVPDLGFADTSAFIRYTFPERKSYRLSLKTEKSPCSVIQEKVLEVADPPLILKADFDYRLRFEECEKVPLLILENKSAAASSQRWSWNGNSSAAIVPSPDLSGLDSVILRLEVFSDSCKREISRLIQVHKLLPPNLITLRKDGLNDEFSILHLPEKSSIEIWDRWGNRVFKEEDYRNNWRPEAEGTYFYQLKFGNGASCTSWIQAVR
jgi:hypothetical protein